MATDIELKRIPSIGLVRYWGGDTKRSCIQITQNNSRVETDTILNYQSIQLTKKEAMTLGLALIDFGRDKEVETYKHKALKDWKEK